MIGQYLADPSVATALMGAGGAMMSAGQPSRVPVGLGSAIGGAMQGGLGGYLMSEQAIRDRKMNELLDQRLAGILGGAGARGAQVAQGAPTPLFGQPPVAMGGAPRQPAPVPIGGVPRIGGIY